MCKLTNPRDFATGNYRRVDDRPFGGGPGMVMMAEPLELALCPHSVAARRCRTGCAFFSPAGAEIMPWCSAGPLASGPSWFVAATKALTSAFIDAHVKSRSAWVILCLSGGEVAAMALLDAVARLQPGVLSDSEQPPARTASTPRWMVCWIARTTRARRVGGQLVPPMYAVGPSWPDRALAARPAAAPEPPSTDLICWSHCAQGRASHSVG
jgi:tRNA (guanine37-N1)-methyltransferase